MAWTIAILTPKGGRVTVGTRLQDLSEAQEMVKRVYGNKIQITGQQTKLASKICDTIHLVLAGFCHW